MTKTITMTFLLRNPAKVRDLVNQGIELLVKFEGKIVMVIKFPQDLPAISSLSNRKKHNLGINKPLSRKEIYSDSSWLNK
jgi:hypothetical protein